MSTAVNRHVVDEHAGTPDTATQRVGTRRVGTRRATIAGDPAPRRVLAVLRETLLNIAAVGGAVCILLVILALLCDMTLIMFRTGSMSPGIPAGSVALVQEIPAADVVVGDVVTVDRAGTLPITHRVTSMTDGGGDTRILTLKGDANETGDPAPYTVTSVRRVLGSVPGLAPVIVGLSEPPVLAGITLAVAGLVTWGSWPTSSTAQAAPATRRSSRQRRRASRSTARSTRAADGARHSRNSRHAGDQGRRLDGGTVPRSIDG